VVPRAHAPPFFLPIFLLTKHAKGEPLHATNITGKNIPPSEIVSGERSILVSAPLFLIVISLKHSQGESAATPVSTLSQGDLQL
jgi:hypothetical protein